MLKPDTGFAPFIKVRCQREYPPGMPTKSARTLLIEAPQNRHFCQIHREPQLLAATIGLFVESGLKRGERVLVVASGSQRSALVEKITAAGMDAATLQESGRLQLLDSRLLLTRFMRGGMPDPGEFRKTVGKLVERVVRDRKLRIYGEMVNDLWRAGNTAAAIRLEELWNELARHHRFSLYCGYHLDGLDEASYAGPLDEIGRTHTDIGVTEDDPQFLTTLDAASRDVLGIPISQLLSSSGSGKRSGEHRLPLSYRTLWWLRRNLPSAMTKILRRAQRYADMPTLPTRAPREY